MSQLSKRILSFDIGIKNMALCMFSLDLSNNESNNPFSIDQWKVLNLMDESNEPTEKCNQILPKKPVKKSKKSIKSVILRLLSK